MLPPATRSFSVTLFIALQFTWSIICSYQKEKEKTLQKTTQFEESKKASEQDVAQMLELSNKEFKTMVNYDKRSSGYRAPKNTQVVEAER